VACTQKPSSAVVGSLAKANFPVRLVGRVTSPEEAKVATGYSGTGAELLSGPGDFLAISGGQVTRFQTAYVTPHEVAEAVGRLLQGEGRSRMTSASNSGVRQEGQQPLLVDGAEGGPLRGVAERLLRRGDGARA
jgi:DNA segregation ATPase FtsK/SpoIIIE-like protein